MTLEYTGHRATETIQLAGDDPFAKLVRDNMIRIRMGIVTSDRLALLYVRRSDGGTVQARVNEEV